MITENSISEIVEEPKKSAQVISVKRFDLKVLGFDDLEHWLCASPNHIYIGRSFIHYISGTVANKWSIPFKYEKYEREESLKRYEEYVRNNSELMQTIEELDGKILGCWCFPDLACHGEILVKILEEKKASSLRP